MTTHTGSKNKPLRPSWLRRRLARWALLPYRLGLGALLARQVMVLTTTGRVTGRARRTPLWYVRDGDIVYCLSGWGPSSDWLKNLQADPHALVQIGKKRWETLGAFIQEPQEVEKVLRVFQRKYGRLVPLFYHLDRLILVAFPAGGPSIPTRRDSGQAPGD